MAVRYAPTYKRKDLLVVIGVSEAQWSSWVRMANFPKSFRRGHYVSEEVAEWIVENKYKIKKNSKEIIETAYLILAQLQTTRRDKNESTKAKRRQIRDEKKAAQGGATGPTPELKFGNIKKGLEHSLSRMEEMEAYTANLINHFNREGDIAGALGVMDSWNKSADALRKSQLETLKVLQQQGTLIPLAMAEDFVARNIMPAQRELLRVPIMMAEELEFLDKVEIEKILDKKIREILSKIATSFHEGD